MRLLLVMKTNVSDSFIERGDFHLEQYGGQVKDEKRSNVTR